MKCSHVKPDGRRCGGWAVSGSEYCFFHDPAKKRELKAAQSRGYANSLAPTRSLSVPALPQDTPDVLIETADDVVKLCSETISQVRRAELDTKIANAIAILARVILAAKEQGDIERRLTELEDLVKKGGQHGQTSAAH